MRYVSHGLLFRTGSRFRCKRDFEDLQMSEALIVRLQKNYNILGECFPPRDRHNRYKMFGVISNPPTCFDQLNLGADFII